MRCPNCGYDDLKVADSRNVGEAGEQVRRRRRCDRCGEIFTTYEKFREVKLKVIDENKKISIFSREHLTKDIVFAAQKTDVTLAYIDKIVTEVEEFIESNVKHQINKSEIIDIVAFRLKEVSHTAYIRYIMDYEDVICVRDLKGAKTR